MACKSRVSGAIATLVGVFHEYASKDGEEVKEKDCGKNACINQFKLSKNELKELVQKELDMHNVNDPDKLNELMNELDDDDDGQVDFLEFVGLVAGLACACNAFLEHILEEEEEEQQQSVCDQAKSE